MENLAPIALFAYRRPDHLQRALISLATNPEFFESELHIFCDGARSPADVSRVVETQQVARDFKHPFKTVIARTSNVGLAASIVSGVTDLCKGRGSVIVVEDDLVVSSTFLAFMNQGLKAFAGVDRVMQISGYMAPVSVPSPHDAVFLPMTTTWGWATWNRAWRHFDPNRTYRKALEESPALRHRFDLDGAYPYFRMLCQQDAGKVDSWGISWYLSVFSNGGLVLYPRKSLVLHDLDGSGTHCRVPQASSSYLSAETFTSLPDVKLDEVALNIVSCHYRSQRKLWRRLSGVVLYYLERAQLWSPRSKVGY